ncbi:hypothetical protein AAA214_02950 [Parabacteroides goldsteinii]|jgi:hypothetical protein|uniref:hypothetical protein n=1 Tax=Parabacteroides goldsteinii TaxID=328812 RepID=UPI0032C07389
MEKVKFLLTVFFVLCVCSISAQKVINEDLYLGENNSITSGWGKKLFFRGTDYNQYDELYMGRYYVSLGKTDLRVTIGDDSGNDDRFVVGNYFSDNVNVWRDLFVVTNKGWVGIGGVSYPQNALEVNGTIRAKEIKVETGWADFVFAPDYNLPSLREVESHIKEHRHLPGIPTEAEVKKNGANLGEMNVKLLQKVEELTLYVIQQNKEIESLKSEVQQLRGK